jgi:hypothetical protein
MDWRNRSDTGNCRLCPADQEVPLDEGVRAETLVQLAREQQVSIGGDRSSAEVDAKLGIEREANRARCRVTHGMMPSGPARSRREPHLLRVLHDYGPIRSPLSERAEFRSVALQITPRR